MNFAVVGYGRMGRAVEVAAEARGHRRVAVVRRGDAISAAALDEAELAFEFTAPSEAETNVLALLGSGIAVVSGTTGWSPSRRLLQAVEESRRGFVLAPNFSLGVQLFFRLAERAREMARAVGGYEAWIHELHHRNKVDAPSGTAVRLGQLVFDEDPGVRIVSTRAGAEPGRHIVGFEGDDDAITLEHRARGRQGFAAGAVVAAEWVVGRRGIHGFEAIVEEILK